MAFFSSRWTVAFSWWENSRREPWAQTAPPQVRFSLPSCSMAISSFRTETSERPRALLSSATVTEDLSSSWCSMYAFRSCITMAVPSSPGPGELPAAPDLVSPILTFLK